MKVKDCMTKDVITVKRSTTLAEIIDVFRKFSFHTLPVIEDDKRLVGVVSFEDILSVFQPYSSDLNRMLKTIPFLGAEEREEDFLFADISSEIGVLAVVDDFMNTEVITVGEETSVKEVQLLLKLHNIGRLPVVSGGRLVGIVSLFDIILAVFRDKGVIR